MVLRVTRRNILLLLFTLSVFGLFIYSQIGSRVNLVKGTVLSSGIRKLDYFSRNDEVAAGENGGKRKGVGILPEGQEEGQKDDVIGVIRFLHESANEADEVDDDEDDDDDAPLDGGSFVRDGSDESIAKGKGMVVIGNHMRIGGNIDKLMKEEGFIRGVNVAGESKKVNKRKEHEKEKQNEKEEEAVVVPRRPIPVKVPVRDSIGNVTKDSRLDPNMQVMVINERSRSREGAKIGDWSRDHQAARQQPVINNGSNETNNSRVPAAAKSGPTHYFYETPEDTKAKKLYMKCLSKLSPLERRAFMTFDKNYRKRESLMKDGMLTIGGKWVIMSEFMRSLGREQRLPQVINIGAKKSGTTAFGWFLNMHPQITHSFGNEVHFFDKNYHKGLQYYRSRMNFAKRNQLVFEKTPRYLVTDSAPENALKDLASDVKFIICIRDPLKRALSDFRHDSTLQVRRAYKMNPAVIKQRTAQSEGERFAAGAFDKFGNVNSSFDSVRTSSYVKHFKNWLSYFPRDRFILVDHQQLVDDAFHELHRVETFLGLTPFFEENMFYYDNRRHGTCVRRTSNPCPPRSSPGFLPAGELTGAEERALRDYFRPLNREFVELVGDNNFTWVNL